LGTSIQGLTISGGEPLQQLRPLLTLLQRVRAETPLSILLFSGYTWEEIQRMPGSDALLANLDVLIAGRYDSTQRLASRLLGSANKTVHFLTDRYTMDDLNSVPETELIVNAKGEIVISGIDPIIW